MKLFHLTRVLAISLGLSGVVHAQINAPPGSPEARLYDTSRFLSQATFGANFELISHVNTVGQTAWLESQFQQPIGYHRPQTAAVVNFIENWLQTQAVPRLEVSESNDSPVVFTALEEAFGSVLEEYLLGARRYAWMQAAITAPDMVRQRVAFALSEIFVVSDRAAELGVQSIGLASYYDVLLQHAFGNYRDLLRDVTLHPVMGLYLSHLNNAKADPATGRFPDENYAREVMQLFSIGLFELNQDGSRKLDAQGQPVPTYSNREITEFAKVFTGLGSANVGFGADEEDAEFATPMVMYEDFHEPGEKRLLNGIVIPPGQSGMQDIEAAIDNLFNHPNVGPFIGRLLIQRLVTSNPNAQYISRVAGVFNNNGSGVRGDLQAVIRAILLDPEARSLEKLNDPTFGHLREPFLRHVALLRIFHASSPSQLFIDQGYELTEVFQQFPLSAPSVFNFFLPNHQPSGVLANTGLVGPEFQLATSTGIVNNVNYLTGQLLDDEASRINELPSEANLICLTNMTICEKILRCQISAEMSGTPLDEEFDPIQTCLSAGERAEIAALEQAFVVKPDFSQELLHLSSNIPGLLVYLDLVLTYGTMSDATRQLLTQVLTPLSDEPAFQIRMAIYLMMFSPEYVVAN